MPTSPRLGHKTDIVNNRNKNRELGKMRRQRNVLQMKQQELNELEFQNPRRTKWSGDKQSTWQWIQTWEKNGWTQKFSKKLEDIKKYQIELKTVITKKCTRRNQQITWYRGTDQWTWRQSSANYPSCGEKENSISRPEGSGMIYLKWWK